ncbi:hypothetical protein H8D79_00840 [PVC group bacterium]|nr:hypothetical protein [PVC group bacterium]
MIAGDTDGEAAHSGETAEALARKLAECDRLIKGSLVVNRRKCGNPRCRCARGELHESLAITYKENGRSVLVHVPNHLEAAAERAIGDYRMLKRLVAGISRMNVEQLKRESRKSRRRRGSQVGAAEGGKADRAS